jgi:hypothetical protein
MILLPLVLLVAQLAPPAPLTVYISTVLQPTVGAYADPMPKDVLDILTRIKKQLRKDRALRIVDVQAGADVVLGVTYRQYESEKTGAVAMPIGRMVVVDPTYAKYIVVEVALVTPDVTKSIEASAFSGKKAADMIAKDARAWLQVNADAIRTAR